MWTDLVRRAQPGYVAAPASLLAFTAWQDGNGALANRALDRVLADQPDYSMRLLLRDTFDAGTPPSAAVPSMTPEQVADTYAAPATPGAGDAGPAQPADPPAGSIDPAAPAAAPELPSVPGQAGRASGPARSHVSADLLQEGRRVVTTDNPLLARVRKLLAKAEAAGTTPAEAEALTAKAAGLMARYGIDRALLAAAQPDTDQPADRKVDIDNPWARVQTHLLCGLASALRCQAVIFPRSGARHPDPPLRLRVRHRARRHYTSLLVQRWHGMAAADLPAGVRSVRAWRCSWLLGPKQSVSSKASRHRPIPAPLDEFV